jgi:cob(I)alamin adenosyltransferase
MARTRPQRCPWDKFSEYTTLTSAISAARKIERLPERALVALLEAKGLHNRVLRIHHDLP